MSFTLHILYSYLEIRYIHILSPSHSFTELTFYPPKRYCFSEKKGHFMKIKHSFFLVKGYFSFVKYPLISESHFLFLVGCLPSSLIVLIFFVKDGE